MLKQIQKPHFHGVVGCAGQRKVGRGQSFWFLFKHFSQNVFLLQKPRIHGVVATQIYKGTKLFFFCCFDLFGFFWKREPESFTTSNTFMVRDIFPNSTLRARHKCRTCKLPWRGTNETSPDWCQMTCLHQTASLRCDPRICLIGSS